MFSVEKAKDMLYSKDYTCVIMGKDLLYTSKKRGVAPLLERYDSGVDYSGCVAADKVIGRGAAFMYILLGVKDIYVKVISQPSLELLEKYNINVEYDELVPAIRNRDNTGFCPIETAVKGIENLDEAMLRIREKTALLAQGK